MKGVLVDSNVLVSYLLDRAPEQQRRAAALIEAAENPARPILVHQLVLAETGFVLGRVYGQAPAEVSQTLSELLAVPGVVPVDALDWTRALDLWPASLPHFLDACLVSAAELLGPDAVATFDRPFARRLAKLGLRSLWS